MEEPATRTEIEQRLEQSKGLRHQGKNLEALGLLQETLSLCVDADMQEEKAKTLGNLGLVYKGLARFEEAADAFQQASTLFRKLSLWTDLAASTNNLGSTLSELGRIEEGLRLYTDARRIYEAHGTLQDKAICEQFLGNAYLRLSNLDAAEAHYRIADKLYEQVNDPINQAHLKANLGTLAHRRGDLTSAAEYSRQALALYQGANNVRGVVVALNNLGGTLMDMGNFSQAITHLEEAFRLADTSNLIDFAWRIAGNLAEWYLRQGDTMNALDAYSRAVALIDDLRSQLQTRTNRMDFVRQRLSRYRDLIYIAVHEAKMATLALESAERARSRVLIEDLSVSQLTVTAQLSSDWLQEERRLLDEIRSLRDAVATSNNLERIKVLQLQLDQHWHAIGNEASEYVALRRGDPLSYHELLILLRT